MTYEFKSFTGTICSGDLIFEDNFDFFDFKKWEHENTLGGGGVSIYMHKFYVEIQYCENEIVILRIGNFNGTQTIVQTHLLRMDDY